MNPPIAVGPMERQHLDAVLAIQRRCYDASKQESAASFLSKLEAAPDTCFVAWLGPAVVGYLVSVPAVAGSPLPLHSEACPLPPGADALYLHDLAVDPRARGAGVAARLVQTYLAGLRKAGLRHGALTAVNDSAPFWRRHGFEAAAPFGPGAAHLAAYGDDALYMQLHMAPRAVCQAPIVEGPTG